MKRKPFSHWPWYVTGPLLAAVLIVFWKLDASILSETKTPVTLLLENPLLTFGLVILGAFFSAYLSGDMDLRSPLTWEPYGYAFCGGGLMGVGAVMASMSVHSVALFNLAGVFHLTAFMTLQGVLYVFFMILGGFAGARIFLFLMARPALTNDRIKIPEELSSSGAWRWLFLWGIGLVVLGLLAVAFFSVLPVNERMKCLAAVSLFLVFGAIVERGTVCMSSMLKEWFLAQSAYVWRGVLFSVMCLALFYQLGVAAGWCPRFIPTEFVPQVGMLALGSFCMGAAFIFADGCFIGSLWKIGQGNLVNVAGFLGMLLGTGLARWLMPGGAGTHLGSLPNDLELLFPRGVFLIMLWVTGLWVLLINRPRRTW